MQAFEGKLPYDIKSAKSIFEYDPKGKAAFAYLSLTKEVLAHGC